MKFTPGPWEVWTSSSFRRIGSHDGMVCEPVVQNDGHPDLYFRNGGPDGPDAHLLTAAPDLYEALSRYSSECMVMNPEPNCPCRGCATRAALAKARGEKS